MSELDSWNEEMQSAYLYQVVAQAEAGTPRRALFLELRQEAEKQAAIWAQRIEGAGGQRPLVFTPGLRARLVAALTQRLGVRTMQGVLAAMKVRGMSLYTKGDTRHFVPESTAGQEGRHRGLAGGGNLRAAVFGINDGLVSNASLILGVAGASADNKVILLSGVAGLLAGAFSMASGEYVSVRSQREMFEYQIGLERDELAEYPEEEAHELALIYVARGMLPDEAAREAAAAIADPDRALDTLAREELGLNPDELGSPWGAAVFSFLSFALGALLPLAPYVFSAGGHALLASIVLTAVSLFGVGAALSLFTGRHAWRGGLRMLMIGAAAGALTFVIGRQLGVTLG
jgi:VIT1/CCC1 family predicted Fe2+/Mn2+ transporter